MNLRATLKKAFDAVKDFSKPVYGPYRPEEQVIPLLAKRGYEVRQDFWSPMAIGVPVVVYGIFDQEGRRMSELSPKEVKDAYKAAYEDAKREAGLLPAAGEQPTGPAPK